MITLQHHATLCALKKKKKKKKKKKTPDSNSISGGHFMGHKHHENHSDGLHIQKMKPTVSTLR